MNEHEIQCALIEEVGWLSNTHPELTLLFAIPNGGKRHIRTAIKLKKEGVKSGVPDLLLAYPKGGYNGFFIELKAGKNKPTKEQLAWQEALKRAGYRVGVYWSKDDALKAILDYLGSGGRV